MKSTIKNIILVVALSAVILMIMGVALYDYIPSGVTVAKANTYETDVATTKILSDIADLNENNFLKDDTMNSANTGNVILQTYSITKADLALYRATGDLKQGKANPLKVQEESTEGNTSSGQTSTGGQTGNTTSGSNTSSGNHTNSSDGTLFNSTSSK